MHISDILRTKGTEVVMVPPDLLVRELLDVFKARNLGAVVVSVEDRVALGIVSERDVVRHLTDGPTTLDQPVHLIMTPADRMHTCTASDTVDSLAQLMTERRVRHIPVLDDDGLLAGIVSIGDVLKTRIGELTSERDELEAYVST
ncbi:CBS domain-containing protein [Microlunatus endophyticus]|uniref:CBS domain-containing protein n=1 Tax=Microlunatus endophyticus TaxID=1716077 RepID=A0A917S421_9ACTN|nr:CBS domain-containing protein [Microlunatus endophyticus]GGL53991.1 CBS domain-containing protein [Microlunatus endophyticus]